MCAGTGAMCLGSSFSICCVARGPANCAAAEGDHYRGLQMPFSPKTACRLASRVPCCGSRRSLAARRRGPCQL
eukprot:11375777-Alexandrium_andersonii.AAC.1